LGGSFVEGVWALQDYRRARNSPGAVLAYLRAPLKPKALVTPTKHLKIALASPTRHKGFTRLALPVCLF